MCKVLVCPERLEATKLTDFIKNIWNHVDEPIIDFDFSNINYVFPYSTLILAESIRDLVEKRKKNKLLTRITRWDKVSKAINYLKYFGFFKFIGIDMGNAPNFDRGSLNYLPITMLSNDDLLMEAGSKILQEKIDKRSDRLAETIFKNRNPSAQIMISYCLREIIRNVFEHAEIDYCTFMAQSWASGDVEIAIVDRGIGIYRSLSKVYEFSTIEESLKCAIKPGVSSNLDESNKSKWANSGFGLYVTSKLCEQFGEFSILSSDKLLTISKGNESFVDFIFQGTAIKLRINVLESDYFPNILHNIVEEGEKITTEKNGKRKIASKMSKEVRKTL